MEPPVRTYRFATESENEVAITIMPERKANVEEMNMVLSSLISFFYCMPHGEQVRMKNRMAFLSRYIKPKHRVGLRINHDASAYDSVFVNSDVDVPITTFTEQEKHLLVGNEALFAEAEIGSKESV